MALVAITALVTALMFLGLRLVGDRGRALFPAIVVNYITAGALGLLIARPWQLSGLDILVGPAVLEGGLFILFFHLMGLSARRAGVTVTTVATKMSLVVTVAIAVFFFKEETGAWSWVGIGLGLLGVVLTTLTPAKATETADAGVWWLPVIVFIGSVCTDTVINMVQRTHLTPATESAFTAFTFCTAAVIGLVVLLFHPQRKALVQRDTWIAGGLLGIVNYGSIYFLIITLTRSGWPSSQVFPLVNIGTILIGTALAVWYFKEKLTPVRWAGIACCVIALAILIGTRAA